MSDDEPSPREDALPTGEPDRLIEVQPEVGRRTLLSGAIVGVAAIAVGVRPWRDSSLSYRELPNLPPFRELVSDGAVSTASLAFAGLSDGTVEPDLVARVALIRADPCAALFGGSSDDGMTQIAYFSDFNCPYCRVLEGELDRVLRADPNLLLVRHELPLLGGASASAARAVLAADLQGQYDALKARLLRAGLITDEPYLRAVTPALGIDPDRLVRDMASPAIADRLLTSRALGQAFGIVGTPALVVGRTLVMGAVSARTVERVVRDDRATNSAPCDGRKGPTLESQPGIAENG